MTSTRSIYTCGEPGAIRPVQCEPWCVDGDGHAGASDRDEHVCWGPQSYIEATTEEVKLEYDKQSDTTTVFPPRLGVSAYRGFNQYPQVYVHIDLPAHRDGIDVSVKLTGGEAVRLAADLLMAAELIGTGSPESASE